MHAKEPPKIRNKYRKVATAVRELIYSSYLEGHVIILPTEQVILHIEDRHFSAIHWTVNKDKDPPGQNADGHGWQMSFEARSRTPRSRF